ncbi:MAG: sigma-70 family RNA polymerase sigma factor [Phycisphaerales bacterium]|nr:MAG: sigma-70 family RNA polymerase sigma factor [Phycisphaerales bacterium]
MRPHTFSSTKAHDSPDCLHSDWPCNCVKHSNRPKCGILRKFFSSQACSLVMKHHAPERTVESRPDRDELVELWRLHRGWVRGVIIAHQPRGVDTDDLLQEVATKLVQHWQNLKDRDAIGPWLRTVAVNLARSAGRTYKRRDARTRSLDHEPNGTDFPQQSDLHTADDPVQDRGRRALESVHALPTHYRDPLLLALRGLSYREISVALELPISTIETRLCRARAMVRDAMTPHELHDPSPIATPPLRRVNP